MADILFKIIYYLLIVLLLVCYVSGVFLGKNAGDIDEDIGLVTDP